MLIGASGHAKIVVEAIQARDFDCQIILTDQDESKFQEVLLGYISINKLDDWDQLPEHCHISIGDNAIRKQLSDVAQRAGKLAYTVIHPEASVSPTATIGAGSFIAAKAIIGPEAIVGEGCIINHGAIVDHDCRVGAFSHIAPNATLGGAVEIGISCLIGAGSVVLPLMTIGCNATVGAGAVVNQNIVDEQTVVGIPARQV